MSQVQVCVRVRPLSETELESGFKNVVTVPNSSDGSLFVSKPIKHLSIAEQQEKIKKRDIGSNFSFDKVFDSSNPQSTSSSTQDHIFEYIGRRVIETAFNAFNCTVFAYGQTGSGKTFTLMGPQDEDRGLVPRTCEYLFQEIQRLNDENPEDTFSRFKVEISFLEIYNEKVRDLLLSPSIDTGQGKSSRAKQTLRVREHPKEGVIVEGLSRHIVNDYDAVEDFLRRGNLVRVSGATHVHEQSSRSHAIFTIHFVQADMSEDGVPNERVSRINLVDLAGSERADPSSDYNRERFKEGVNINKSLVALGNVIDSLAELSQQQSSSRQASAVGEKARQTQQPSIHVPYRESVLTFLLRDSLGGNAFTTMIATISPSSNSYHETMSTLRYASRTQVIKNQPIKNEDPQIKLIRELKSQVDKLKQMLEQKGGLDGVSEVLEQKVHQGQEQIDNLTQQWTNQWERQKLLLQDSITHDTTGLTVNSEYPHLVGFPNNSSKSKAFVVYQLLPGSFSIGSGDHEIGIQGKPKDEVQGVIKNVNGVVTLTPHSPDLFQINSVDITRSSVLYNGCLVQLGQNLFRYWDPRSSQAQNAKTYKEGEMGDEGRPTDNDNELGTNMATPQFSRLRGLDRAASVMSFQSVDMDDSGIGGEGLEARARMRNTLVSERTQSMVSLMSNQEVMQKVALADSLAEQLNLAHKQLEDLRGERQFKDAQEEEKQMALENLQFDYQEQICEHQERIEQLLVEKEKMQEQGDAEIQRLQEKLDDKKEKEKAKLDEEIEKIDRQMQQIHAKKKTAKTTMAKSNLEKEEIEVMGRLKNLREREKKLKESLKSTENQIREKEKKMTAKKKKYEEKLIKMQAELHSIKAQYLDRHMKTSMAMSVTGSRAKLQSDYLEDNEMGEPRPHTVDVEGEMVTLRSKRGRAASDVRNVNSIQPAQKSGFAELLERRKREREASAPDNQKPTQSNLINVAIGEDDQGKPMYLKISLRDSQELLDENEDSDQSKQDKSRFEKKGKRTQAKERALSMDLADLQKLTKFQDITVNEPQQYESGENMLVLPSESGRNILMQKFMSDLGRSSVSDVRSNFGYSHEKLVQYSSEMNLKTERHCEAGVHVLSPSSSCKTLQLETPIQATMSYHEVKPRVDSHLLIKEPLNISKVKITKEKRRFSDYGTNSTTTRATSPTTHSSGDSVFGRQSQDDKKILRRVIDGPHGFRPVSQDITAYPVTAQKERKPRPKSLYSQPEFDDENRENEWDFAPLTRTQSGQIRRPFEVRQAEGHHARIGPKVMLTKTPPVTVTAIPGHMLAEHPNLVPKSSDPHLASGSSKFLRLRREMQDKQKAKPADVSHSSIRSNAQSFSVISSREDLKEANDSFLRRRLYSTNNQSFLAESATFNDSRIEQEVIVDSMEMWKNEMAKKRSQPHLAADQQPQQQLPQRRPLSEAAVFQVDFDSREDDLEVAHHSEYYQQEESFGQSRTVEPTVVRRRVNPNRSKLFEEKRMSWPVNRKEKLTTEMESQPLFIKQYPYESQESMHLESEYTNEENWYLNEVAEQEEFYESEEDEDGNVVSLKTVFISRESKSPHDVNTNEVIVQEPPKILYQTPRTVLSKSTIRTETEGETLEDNQYLMDVYIESKKSNEDNENSEIKQNQFEIEPQFFRFPSVNRLSTEVGIDHETKQEKKASRRVGSQNFRSVSQTPTAYPVSSRLRPSEFEIGGSHSNVSRHSDVFSTSSGHNLITPESAGAFRNIEETFTTESIITKGNEKKTKAGKVLGKWRMIKKKDKASSEGRERFLSTIETSVNPSTKKIKFDKTLSTASVNSVGSVKKLRNQASSPIEFEKPKKRKVSYLTFKRDNESSLTGDFRIDMTQSNKDFSSPKTPSSTISTQTPNDAATQTKEPEVQQSTTPSVSNYGQTTEQFVETTRSITRVFSPSVRQMEDKGSGNRDRYQYRKKRSARYGNSSDSDRSYYYSSTDSDTKRRGKHVRSRYARHSHMSRRRQGRSLGYKKRESKGSSETNSNSEEQMRSKRKKSETKMSKDATTNTVNEIGVQTEEVKEPNAVATNTDTFHSQSSSQKVQRGHSNGEINFLIQDFTVSSESVQTLTYKSSPATFRKVPKDNLMSERAASMENIPSRRVGGLSHRPVSSKGRHRRPEVDDKQEIFEFMTSLDSVKVEEYLHMLQLAGVSQDLLQKFLRALQLNDPGAIPDDIMQYFDTRSASLAPNRRTTFTRDETETMTNVKSFVTFSNYLSLADEILGSHPSVSDTERQQVLDALRKQDSTLIPKSIDPRILKEVEEATSSLINDDLVPDSTRSEDTASVIESDYISGTEMKRRNSATFQQSRNSLSPFERTNQSVDSPLNDTNQPQGHNEGHLDHKRKTSIIERLKQRSKTAGALDAWATMHGQLKSPSRAQNSPGDAVPPLAENLAVELNNQPVDLFANLENSQSENSKRRISKGDQQSNFGDDAPRESVTTAPVGKDVVKNSSGELLPSSSSASVWPATEFTLSKLPLEVRYQIAAQILVTAHPNQCRDMLDEAGAQPNMVAMVTALRANGQPREIRDAVATLLGDSITKAVLEINGQSRCQEALNQLHSQLNDDSSLGVFALSDELKSEQAVAEETPKSYFSAVTVLAAHALVNLNKGERNFWLEKLGVFNVVKDEVKDAIQRRDIEKLCKLLPEDCAKFLLENLPGKKLKESISVVLKEPENELHRHLVRFVAQSLLDDSLELTSEILSSTMIDKNTEHEILSAIADRNEEKIKSLLTNEIIDTIIGEISSDAIVNSLTNNGRPSKTSSRKGSMNSFDSRPIKTDGDSGFVKPTTTKTSEKSSKKRSGSFEVDEGIIITGEAKCKVSTIAKGSKPIGEKFKEPNSILDSAEDTTRKLETVTPSQFENGVLKEPKPAEKNENMTAQKITASVMIDWHGEQILAFITDMDPEIQSDILDSIIGGDIAKLSTLIKEESANEILKDFDPFQFAPVVEKTQERFANPSEFLTPDNVEEMNDYLNILSKAYDENTEKLRDTLASFDVDVATKIFDALVNGDLIAAKALLWTAATNEDSNLGRKHSYSDSALGNERSGRRLSGSLFSKSESELAIKPQGNTTVSKEVLGEFYDVAPMGPEPKVVYVEVAEPTQIEPSPEIEMGPESEPAELPEELQEILSKYVHPDDIYGLYDAIYNNPDLVAQNLPEDEYRKLYEEIDDYEQRETQKLDRIFNVAADTLKDIHPFEMDDLVEKMQQSQPDDVQPFCDLVKEKNFIAAVRYLPDDILEEIMDHNQSLLGDQVSDSSKRDTVPVIREEDEDFDFYEEDDMLSPFGGTLKKDDPTSLGGGILKKDELTNSAKNLQVQFAPEVMEFNLTNPSMGEETMDSSSLASDTHGPGNDSVSGTGDTNDDNTGSEPIKSDLDDITSKIAALEDRMSQIEKSDSNHEDSDSQSSDENWEAKETDDGVYPSERNLGETGNSTSEDESQKDIIRSDPNGDLTDPKLKQMETNQEQPVLEFEEINPEQRQARALHSELPELFPNKESVGQSSVSSGDELSRDDDDHLRKRLNVLEDIDNWEKNQDPLYADDSLGDNQDDREVLNVEVIEEPGLVESRRDGVFQLQDLPPTDSLNNLEQSDRSQEESRSLNMFEVWPGDEKAASGANSSVDLSFESEPIHDLRLVDPKSKDEPGEIPSPSASNESLQEKPKSKPSNELQNAVDTNPYGISSSPETETSLMHPQNKGQNILSGSLKPASYNRGYLGPDNSKDSDMKNPEDNFAQSEDPNFGPFESSENWNPGSQTSEILDKEPSLDRLSRFKNPSPELLLPGKTKFNKPKSQSENTAAISSSKPNDFLNQDWTNIYPPSLGKENNPIPEKISDEETENYPVAEPAQRRKTRPIYDPSPPTKSNNLGPKPTASSQIPGLLDDAKSDLPKLDTNGTGKVAPHNEKPFKPTSQVEKPEVTNNQPRHQKRETNQPEANKGDVTSKPVLIDTKNVIGFLRDVWPSGIAPDDSGYITVKEVDARVGVIAGPPPTPTEPLNSANKIQYKFESVKERSNEALEPKELDAEIRSPLRGIDSRDPREIHGEPLEEDFIPKQPGRNVQKEPDWKAFEDLESEDLKTDDLLSQNELSDGDVGSTIGGEDDEEEYFVVGLPADCDEDTKKQVQMMLKDPEMLNRIMQSDTPVVSFDGDNPTLADEISENPSEFDDLEFESQIGKPIRTLVDEIAQTDPESSSAQKPSLPDNWLVSKLKVPPSVTNERGSQTALDRWSDRENVHPARINLNIDVRISNDDDDSSSTEHLQKSTTANQHDSSPSETHSPKSSKRPTSIKHQKSRETQTATRPTSERADDRVRISSNQQSLFNKPINSDEHMDLIEFSFIPGHKNSPSIEELEMKCSRAVGEVNGLLKSLDQITPPGSPRSRSRYPNPASRETIITSKTSRGYRPYSSEFIDNLEDNFGFRPRGSGSPTSRCRALYPTLLQIPSSNCDPEIAKKWEQTMETIRQAPHGPQNDRAPFTFSKGNISPIRNPQVHSLGNPTTYQTHTHCNDSLECTCPPVYERSLPIMNSTAGLTVPNKPTGRSYIQPKPGLNQGSAFPSDTRHSDVICTCPKEHKHSFSRLRLANPEPLSDSRFTTKYFVRSQLTKTPFQRVPDLDNPSNPVCTCNRWSPGESHVTGCPLCYLEERHNRLVDDCCVCELNLTL